MNCPRCRVIGLHTGEADSLTVRACGRCGGVWLDPADADKLLAWVRVEPWREPVHVDCAECHQPMQGRYVPEANIVIDVCPGHGTWFDHQELERLAGAVAHKRGRPAPALPKPAGSGGALAGLVAASAVTAFVLVSGEGAAPDHSEDARHAADVALEGVIVAPDVAVAGAHLTAEAGGSVIEAGSAVISDGGGVVVEAASVVVEGGAEAAGGFVSGIAELLAGLLS